ncbi:MAG: Rossmann fold domain-containing protein [Pseudomonadota bacterium]
MALGSHVEVVGRELGKTRSPLDAHAAFVAHDLALVQDTIERDAVTSLTIVLSPASSDHDSWRRAIAGDLARAYTPKRVNVAAGRTGEVLDNLLAFLRDAPGVTGHYVQAHD